MEARRGGSADPLASSPPSVTVKTWGTQGGTWVKRERRKGTKRWRLGREAGGSDPCLHVSGGVQVREFQRFREELRATLELGARDAASSGRRGLGNRSETWPLYVVHDAAAGIPENRGSKHEGEKRRPTFPYPDVPADCSEAKTTATGIKRQRASQDHAPRPRDDWEVSLWASCRRGSREEGWSVVGVRCHGREVGGRGAGHAGQQTPDLSHP